MNSIYKHIQGLIIIIPSLSMVEAEVCEYELDNYLVALQPKSKNVLDISILDVGKLNRFTITDYKLSNITVESIKRAFTHKPESKYEIKVDEEEGELPSLKLTIIISTQYLRDITQSIQFAKPIKIPTVSLIEKRLSFLQSRIKELMKAEKSSKYYSYNAEVAGRVYPEKYNKYQQDGYEDDYCQDDGYQDEYNSNDGYDGNFAPIISIQISEEGNYLIQLSLLAKTPATTIYFYDNSSFTTFIPNPISMKRSEGWIPINVSKIVCATEGKKIEIMIADENTARISAKNIVMTAKKL